MALHIDALQLLRGHWFPRTKSSTSQHHQLRCCCLQVHNNRPELLKLSTMQRLGHAVRHHFISWAELYVNETVIFLIFDKEESDV